MTSARNYWSDEDLKGDAAFWRQKQKEYIGRLDTGPEYFARKANVAKLRAEASENVLQRRKDRAS